MSDNPIEQLQREARRARTARAEVAGGMSRRPYADLGDVTASNGSIIYVTDGRKTGESAGSGTGVPAYYSNGQWLTFSGDVAVTI